MKFIEVVDGFSVRIDAITSVKRVGGNRVLIETENREYEFVADFKMLMLGLDEEERNETETEKLTTQYFGG